MRGISGPEFRGNSANEFKSPKLSEDEISPFGPIYIIIQITTCTINEHTYI